MLTALAITGETAPLYPTSISHRAVRNKPQDSRRQPVSAHEPTADRRNHHERY